MRAPCASSPMLASSDAADGVIAAPATTTDGLLGGRVRYTQPEHGFRSGLEPVLLAAAIPARAGQRVLEAGCASGAGLLCLAARVGGVEGVGIDCDPALVRLAARNAAQNGMPDLGFAVADVLAASPRGSDDAGRCGFGGFGRFHHAFANPPYHPDTGVASPDPGRRQAKQAEPGLIGAWTAALARCLHPRGTLTLILPPAALPEALAAMQAARCAARAMLPLWPRLGRPARLVLVQGVRGGRSPFRVLPGLVLHEADGFTQAADAVLRDAAALPMA